MLPNIDSPAVRRWVAGALKRYGSNTDLPAVPPSALVAMATTTHPSQIQCLLLFQCLQGLRSGHFKLITSTHLTLADIVLPPFKKKRVSTVLSIAHIPREVTMRVLSMTSDMHTPFVPFSVQQYRAAVVKACRELGHRVTGGAARRSFATIQSYLDTPERTIGQYLCHSVTSGASTSTYIKPLPAFEIRCIQQHPNLF